MTRHSHRILFVALWAAAFATAAGAQVISTVVGNISAADGLQARETPLVIPRAVTVDQDGFIYIADDGSGTVRRIDPITGIATVIAGGGTVVDDLIPVPGKSAFLNSPVGVGIGAGRNLYIADDGNNRVRLLTPDGFLTTVVGNGSSGFSGDGGPATRAQLFLPTGVATDSAGNLYITDRGNEAIRKVDAASAVITTIAGGPFANSFSDGIPATAARLFSPYGIAVDGAGNVFFADEDDHLVRKIEAATGLIRTVAGTGFSGTSGDGGPATAANLRNPAGVAVAPNGDLYIGHSGQVRKVDAATGVITTVLGGGNFILSEGRPGTDVFIPSSIRHMFLTPANVLLIALTGDNLIGQLNLTTGIFSILAGDPLRVGDSGLAETAAVSQPHLLALDATGNLYIADKFHHRVRRILPGTGGAGTGTITTVVGDGFPAFGETSGPAASTSITFPEGTFVDASNRVYFTDNFRRVRMVDGDGMLQTVAGLSTIGFSGDGGPATEAELNTPRGITMDGASNLYIADTFNDRVRKIDLNGIIQTIAGTGEFGFSGDGGQATRAQLNGPYDLLLDGDGSLLIADHFNNRVWRMDLSTGIITTFAGNGFFAYSGDGGPATDAGISRPRGLAMDGQGNVLITSVNTVRRVDAATGIISTVAGAGDPGFRGDGGLATLARLSGVQGIVVDSAGNAIFADSVNNRIRRISSVAVIPLLAVSPTALSFGALEGGQSPAGQSLQVSTSNLASTSWTASVQLASGSGWLTVQPISGMTPAVVQIAVNSSGLPAGTFTGSITITAAGATNSPQTVSVTLTVEPGGNPKLALDPQFLTFRATQGGADPPPQTVTLTNAGGGVLQWSGTVQASGGNWLSVSPSSGTGAATLTLSTTLGSLPAGVYQGLLLVTNLSAGESVAVSVAFIVSEPVSSLLLSQTGALFTVNEGGSFVPPGDVLVVNAGQGSMIWQAEVLPLSGGNWLGLSAASGTSAPDLATTLQLSPSPAGLSPGVYDALLQVSASGATNSPQLLLARLQVQPSGTAPVGSINPGGIALVGESGGAIQQGSLTVSTTGGATLSYATSASTSDGALWLSVSPPGGSLQGSADRGTVNVQANPAQLSPGVYRGKVAVAFSTGVTQDVSVLLVVTPQGTAVASGGSYTGAGLAQSACTPTQQFPLQVALTNGSSVPTGFGTVVQVSVLDDCGIAVDNSVVVIQFGNGDPALVLDPKKRVGPGLYSGTWKPGQQGATEVTVQATGSGLAPGQTDLQVVISEQGAALSSPEIFTNGAVHGAHFNLIGGVKQVAPLARGQIFSVFGNRLAIGRSFADQVPLPRSLAGVTAKLAGTDVPLFFSDTGQLNAQIPFELPSGGTFPLVVTMGGLGSSPELITLTNTQPGIFTVAQSGSGPGVITDAPGTLIATANPARLGQVVIVYATGLGPTNPTVPTGEATPFGTLARVVDGLTVTVGGVPAAVDFAGLTPGFVGLYQVNVRIPDNAPLGDGVELFLEQNQIRSNTVTLVIQ